MPRKAVSVDTTLAVTRDLDGSLRPVSTDPERLRLALVNILMNAATRRHGQAGRAPTRTNPAEDAQTGL